MFGESLLKFVVFCGLGEFWGSLDQLILSALEVSKFFKHDLA
jgi:hypothetical protein